MASASVRKVMASAREPVFSSLTYSTSKTSMWVCNNQPSSVLHALTDISFLIHQLVWRKKNNKFICWLIRTDLLGVCWVHADNNSQQCPPSRRRWTTETNIQYQVFPYKNIWLSFCRSSCTSVKRLTYSTLTSIFLLNFVPPHVGTLKISSTFVLNKCPSFAKFVDWCLIRALFITDVKWCGQGPADQREHGGH